MFRIAILCYCPNEESVLTLPPVSESVILGDLCIFSFAGVYSRDKSNKLFMIEFMELESKFPFLEIFLKMRTDLK